MDLKNTEEDFDQMFLSQRVVDDRFTNAFISFMWRWLQLELIAQRINEEIVQLTQVNKDDINAEPFASLTTLIALDIEIFYILIRSVMDDIAALTPCFYPKKLKPNRYSFNKQRNWYTNLKNTDYDPPMIEYLTNNLGWFDESKDIRDDLLHRHAFLFPFPTNNNQQVQFGTLRGTEQEPKIADLIPKLRATLRNILAFLDFYSEHFNNRIKKDWPEYYEELPTVLPDKPVQSFENLNRLLKGICD